MPKEDLKPALRLALRKHEIGDASPYVLSFAGKGNSGGSFGFMQGDLAAGQPAVTETFKKAMSAAGLSDAKIQGLLALLSVHQSVNPLDGPETTQVNDALLASRALVDAMDEGILKGVYEGLDKCIASAAKADRTIEPTAQLYMALWINMTGPPTTLLKWLDGTAPPSASLPPLGKAVDGAAMERYLLATKHYTDNPGNFPHMKGSVVAGTAQLP